MTVATDVIATCAVCPDVFATCQQRKRRRYLPIYMMPQTRRMEKSVVRRASSGVGCSNDKGRSRALHPDSTKTGKSVVRRASSGVGCSNDKGRSQALHPDLSNAACPLTAKRGYSHEFKSNATTGKRTRLFNVALSDGRKCRTR
jgi:hypothetical protein